MFENKWAKVVGFCYNFNTGNYFIFVKICAICIPVAKSVNFVGLFYLVSKE